MHSGWLQGLVFLLLLVLDLSAWAAESLVHKSATHEVDVPRQAQIASSAEAVIAQSPQEVLRWLSNPDLMPRWLPFCQRAELLRFAPPEATLVVTTPGMAGLMGARIQLEQRLLMERDGGFRIVSQTLSTAALPWSAVWQLTPLAHNRTRVRLSLNVDGPGALSPPAAVLHSLPERALAGLVALIERDRVAPNAPSIAGLENYLARVAKQ